MPNKYSIIVRFDKEKQRLKKEKKGNLYLPPQYLYMQYNLQHGEIAAIGALVHEYFPWIKEGDIALVHHIVEHNPIMLVDEDERYEYRVVNATPHDLDHSMSSQVFGIIDNTDYSLRPFDTYLFIDNDLKPIKKEITSSLIYSPGIENDEEYYNSVQADMTARRKSLEGTLINMPVSQMNIREDIDRELANIQRQQEQLAMIASAGQTVNARVLFANEQQSGIKPGELIMTGKDMLYPLTIGDISYLIIRSQFVEKYDLIFE